MYIHTRAYTSAYIHTYIYSSRSNAPDLVLGAAARAPVVGLAGLNLDGHGRFFSADYLVAVLDLGHCCCKDDCEA